MNLSNSRLHWWHLSDLHWQVGQSTERSRFIGALTRHLQLNVQGYGVPDFILMTGDFSYAGQDAQFSEAKKHFFDPILKLTGNPNTPLILAPGNHDQNRRFTRLLDPQLITNISSIDEVTEFLDSPEAVDTVRRPFAAFE